MLAHRKYEQQKIHLPIFAQPKLNGIRAYAKWSKDGSSVVIATRNNVIIPQEVLPRLYKGMEALPKDTILDGELYVHGWPLQRILGAVNRKTPNEDSEKVNLHCFDCYIRGKKAASFAERFMHKSLIHFPLGSGLEHVFTQSITSLDDLDHFHVACVSRGYEGTMIRYGACQYLQDKRNPQLMKRKDWKDMDCVILGVNEGKKTEIDGKYQGTTGSLRLRVEDGEEEFSAGSGLTDKDRDELWEKRKDIKGKAKVKYEMLSNAGVPLKPVILGYELS